MRRGFALLAAMLLAVGVAAPVTAGPPDRSPVSQPIVGFVTDGPVLYDNGFVEASWNGVRAGAAAIGGNAIVAVTSRPSDPAYTRNIERMVHRGAVVVVTVGFLMTNATLAAAADHPSVQFFGIDQPAVDTPANYQALWFNEAQAGYLAGVVAGLVTESGSVGMVGVDQGGMIVPAVLAFMNGYANGVASVDAGIAVLTAWAGSFADPADGYDRAMDLIVGDADVVFGVAGLTTAGVLAAACDAGVWGVGVDVDAWPVYPDFQPCIVTSAEKRLTVAAEDAIIRWWGGGQTQLQSGSFVNDASNDGVGAAPVRNVALTAEQQAFLDAAFAGLADGSIDACAPQACDTVP